jgi:hypothetical protein
MEWKDPQFLRAFLLLHFHIYLFFDPFMIACMFWCLYAHFFCLISSSTCLIFKDGAINARSFSLLFQKLNHKTFSLVLMRFLCKFPFLFNEIKTMHRTHPILPQKACNNKQQQATKVLEAIIMNIMKRQWMLIVMTAYVIFCVFSHLERWKLVVRCKLCHKRISLTFGTLTISV